MPLQSHSKPGAKYCIFSAYRLGKSPAENKHDTMMLGYALRQKDINYKELLGRSDGSREESFIANMEHFDDIAELCEKYNQDNILIMDEPEAHGLRKAYMYAVAEGNKEYMGWVKSVSKDRAKRHDSYSYCALTDTYFIVIKEREVFKT